MTPLPLTTTLLLTLLTSTTPTQTQTPIPTQTLHYTASYAGLNAGQLQIRIHAEPHAYTITSTAKPSILAAMFAKTHDTSTRFTRHNGNLTLHSGTETLAGKNGYQRHFRVDRTAQQIAFSTGTGTNTNTPIHPNDHLEAAAFPLLLMLRPLSEIADTAVREVSAKRLRDYIYQAPVADTVTVPAGTFPAWKITRHRPDQPQDSVAVWLHQADNPIPLQIVVIKRGRRTTLKLTEPPTP